MREMLAASWSVSEVRAVRRVLSGVVGSVCLGRGDVVMLPVFFLSGASAGGRVLRRLSCAHGVAGGVIRCAR